MAPLRRWLLCAGLLPLLSHQPGERSKSWPQTAACYATVSGKTGVIGSFNPASVIQIDMVTSSGATKANTSLLSKDGSSFTDAWCSLEP